MARHRSGTGFLSRIWGRRLLTSCTSKSWMNLADSIAYGKQDLLCERPAEQHESRFVVRRHRRILDRDESALKLPMTDHGVTSTRAPSRQRLRAPKSNPSSSRLP
jgi:hypothetical protein